MDLVEDLVGEDSEGIGNSKDTVVEDLAEDSVEEDSEDIGNLWNTEEDFEDLAEDSAVANSAQESAAGADNQRFLRLRDSSPAAVHSPQNRPPHFPPASS